MFQTSELERDAPLSKLAGPGQHVWRSMSLTSANPMFWASVTTKNDEGTLQREFVFSSLDEVATLLSEQDDDFYVNELLLVSPPWLNDTGNWRLEPLRKVTIGHNKDRGRIVIYRLSGAGNIYVDHLNDDEYQTPIVYSDVKNIIDFEPTIRKSD